MKSKTRFWWTGLGRVGEDTDVYTRGFGCMEKGKERKKDMGGDEMRKGSRMGWMEWKRLVIKASERYETCYWTREEHEGGRYTPFFYRWWWSGSNTNTASHRTAQKSAKITHLPNQEDELDR